MAADPALAALESSVLNKINVLRRFGQEVAAPQPPIAGKNPVVTRPAPLPTPNGRGPFKPLRDPASTGPLLELSEDGKPESSPPTSMKLPPFERLAESRKVTMLQAQYLDLQRAERILGANVERYRQMYVEPIVDKASATAASNSYNTSIFMGMALTYTQLDALLAEISDRLGRYGVAVPDSWVINPTEPTDDENGDDET